MPGRKNPIQIAALKPKTEPDAAQEQRELEEVEATLEQLPEVAPDPERYPCTIAEDVAISILLRGSGAPDYLAGLHASLSDGALGKFKALLDKQEEKDAKARVNTHLPPKSYDLSL
jgi:hypothetical protein